MLKRNFRKFHKLSHYGFDCQHFQSTREFYGDGAAFVFKRKRKTDDIFNHKISDFNFIDVNDGIFDVVVCVCQTEKDLYINPFLFSKTLFRFRCDNKPVYFDSARIESVTRFISGNTRGFFSQNNDILFCIVCFNDLCKAILIRYKNRFAFVVEFSNDECLLIDNVPKKFFSSRADYFSRSVRRFSRCWK